LRIHQNRIAVSPFAPTKLKVIDRWRDREGETTPNHGEWLRSGGMHQRERILVGTFYFIDW